MTRHSVIPTTLTALALVLAVSHGANAKSSSIHTAAPLSPHVVAKAPHERTKTGDIDTTKNGEGTYTKTISGPKDDRVVTITETFADGKTITRTSDDVTTVNANGSVTHDDTTTNGNGKTTVRDLTDTSTGTTGDYTVTGTITKANGKVDTVTGTKDATAYGSDSTTTITNAKGKTETLNSESYHEGDANAHVVTGTGFNGQAIDHAALRTVNGKTPTNGVDTTVDGQGTITRTTTTTVNGVTTVTSDRTFTDGATSQVVAVTTPGTNGVDTVDTSTTYTSASGKVSTSSTDDTDTPNGSGGYNVSGTFTQSNGFSGTVSGTVDKTSYGDVTNLTYSDPNGSTKSTQTESLVIGDTTFNVNTGTNFAGNSYNTAGLFTIPTQQ